MADFTLYADLVGKPFAWGGRGPASYDCFGLLREVYRRWHGVDLPDVASSVEIERNARILTGRAALEWRRLERPEPGAALLMQVRGIGCHVGFAVSRTKLIHACQDESVKIERIGWRFPLMGAYLYVGSRACDAAKAEGAA